MEVVTDSAKVKKAQDGVLEFLLVNHPLDCPVCDKGGECPLQDQTMAYGPGETRFVEEKRHWDKPTPLSPLVLIDRERCIQCARCTRFAEEVAGDAGIDFASRSDTTEVAIFPGEPFVSNFSGNVVQICPVGALLAKPYRFKARPWDLEQVETTCTLCAVGCRVAAQSSSDQVVRFIGVDSDPVNWGWLCDKGRFGFEALNSPERLAHPLVRPPVGAGQRDWPTALVRAPVPASARPVGPKRCRWWPPACRRCDGDQDRRHRRRPPAQRGRLRLVQAGPHRAPHRQRGRPTGRRAARPTWWPACPGRPSTRSAEPRWWYCWPPTSKRNCPSSTCACATRRWKRASPSSSSARRPPGSRRWAAQCLALPAGRAWPPGRRHAPVPRRDEPTSAGVAAAELESRRGGHRGGLAAPVDRPRPAVAGRTGRRRGPGGGRLAGLPGVPVPARPAPLQRPWGHRPRAQPRACCRAGWAWPTGRHGTSSTGGPPAPGDGPRHPRHADPGRRRQAWTSCSCWERTRCRTAPTGSWPPWPCDGPGSWSPSTPLPRASVAYADVVLPAAIYTERRGSFTNIEGRITWLGQKVTRSRHGPARLDDRRRAGHSPGPRPGVGSLEELWAEIQAVSPLHRGVPLSLLVSRQGRNGWSCPCRPMARRREGPRCRRRSTPWPTPVSPQAEIHPAPPVSLAVAGAGVGRANVDGAPGGSASAADAPHAELASRRLQPPATGADRCPRPPVLVAAAGTSSRSAWWPAGPCGTAGAGPAFALAGQHCTRGLSPAGQPRGPGPPRPAAASSKVRVSDHRGSPGGDGGGRHRGSPRARPCCRSTCPGEAPARSSTPRLPFTEVTARAGGRP